MCFSKNTNLFLFLDSCRTGIWLSSLSQTLPRPLRSLFLQTAAHPVSSPRPSLQSEGETEPHDTSLKLQPCFVPPSPGPWVSSGHPGILSSMFHVVVITGWGEGEEGGGSHTCKSSPWHPFLLMVMPLSKAASSPKSQVSTVPICQIPVNLAGRESSQLRTMPLAPNATTSGSMLPSALGLTPDSMKSRLSRSGHNPGTSLGKWNHSTKSWWLWPTSAQPPLEVRNTKTSLLLFQLPDSHYKLMLRCPEAVYFVVISPMT